ncbi:hypothetical protein F4810DRAFT_695618 [Camillea tinctor]|nr:hypothetical protein F4810DRAFT_695618 [Camillea tinctor]
MSGRSMPPRRRLKHCAYCDRVFTKVEHLKRHQRSHTGEKPYKCDICGRSYARSDVLFRHFQTHGDNGQRLTNPVERSPEDSIIRPDGQDRSISTDNNTAESHEAFKHKASNSLIERRVSDPYRRKRLTPSSSRRDNSNDQQSQQCLTDTMPCATLNPYFTDILEEIGQRSPEDFALEYTSSTSLPLEFSTKDTSESNEAFPSTIAQPNFSQVSAHEPPSQYSSSQQQMIPGEGTRTPLNTNHNEEDDSVGNPPMGVPHTYEVQLDAKLSSEFHQVGNNNGDTPQGHNYVFDCGFEEVSIPAEFHFSLDMMDHIVFDDATSLSPTSSPRGKSTSNPSMTFSVEQLKKMQCLWARQKPKSGIRLGRDLWHYVLRHEANNIFSKPRSPSSDSNRPVPRGQRPSKLYIDEECRQGLITYCEEIDSAVRLQKFSDAGLQLRFASASAEGLKETSWVSDDNFPTIYALESSLDFFFQFFYPSFPFMHKSTFDAKSTPVSLLLPICLVGLLYLDRKRSTAFIIRCLQRLMVSCSNDLSYQELDQHPPCELLWTLASTSLVVYLALGFRNELDERIAHSLCVQMLYIAEKNGLFASGHGDSLTLELQHGPSDPEGAWMAWSRIESIKRMIICLLWLDMAYTRLMDTSGVVEMDKVVVHLPCEDALFEATTSTAFIQAAKCGTQLTMPQLNVRKFHEAPPSALNHISAQTLLRALYLQVVAARARLAGTTQLSTVYAFNPVEAFATDLRAKDIIASISTLSTMYASVINGRNTSTALGWNYLCLTLTADLDLLEAASGRDGSEAALEAVVQVSEWSRSAGARRSVLHAAQIFDLLNSSRIRESHITRPDQVLFVSALVLGLYIFVSSEEAATPVTPTFELLQRVDWATVNGEGLAKATGNNTISSTSYGGLSSDSHNPALRFIQYGGPITFAGEVLQNGRVASRKVLLQYAYLLDDFGKWDDSRYSQLLAMMCEFMSEDIGNGDT